MTVSNAIPQLKSEGLIEEIGEPVKQIQRFRILHPKIAAKSVDADLACAKCKVTGKKLNKACYCTPCAKTVHPKVFEAVAAKEKQKIERLISAPRRKAS